MAKRILSAALLAALSPLSLPVSAFDYAKLIAAAAPADETWSLYRNSIVEDGFMWRIHVATFDANLTNSDPVEGGYNQENCRTVRDLMQNRPGITVTYWCERGRRDSYMPSGED